MSFDGDSQRAAELRDQAEQIIGKLEGMSLAFPGSLELVLRMVHELQVHQIELELQNEELRVSRQALVASGRQQAELYELSTATLDAVSAHLCVVEQNGTILHVNQAWSDYYVANGGDLPGERPLVGANYLQVCDRSEGPATEGADEMAEAIRSVLAGQSGKLELEYPCHSPHHQRWFKAVVTPFRARPDLVLVAHEDITERVQAERARQSLESRAMVSLRMEALGTLSSGIAHEFNNLLTEVLGYTELAQHDAQGNEPVLESLREVQDAGTRAAALVRRIQAFSHRSPRELPPARLNSTVAGAVKLLRPMVGPKVDLRVSLSDEAGATRADTAEIHLVVLDLVTNAAHAIGDGEGRIEVILDNFELSGEQAVACGLCPGAYVRLSVSDSGAGMDEATASRVFEPFFTTKGPGEGCGLGLSVVHGIVRSHQGAVTVSSVVGKGTTFVLYFPLLPAQSSEVEPAARQEPARGGGERILVVDDVTALGRILARMLRNFDYVVDVESSPRRALELFLSSPRAFDLLITDLTMPEMSGLELARLTHQARPDLPIILSTGQAAEVTPEMARSAGIVKILSKPYTLSELAEVVRRVIKGAGN